MLVVSLFASLPALAATWTGAVSGAWSNPLNWSPQSVPSSSEALTFPSGASNLVMTNDLAPGTSVGQMTFNDAYTLNGNELTLTGSVTTQTFICNAPLKLDTSIALIHFNDSRYNGAINVNGQTLTINSYQFNAYLGSLNGSGSVVINGYGISIGSSGTFSGKIKGDVDVVGDYPNATVTGDRVSGSGTLGAVTVGRVLSPGSWSPSNTTDSHVRGILQTGSLTLAPPGYNTGETGFFVDLAAGSTSDQLRVNGTVSLSAPVSLHVTITGAPPSNGQIFTIIDNDGTDPINGTFYKPGDGSHPFGPFEELPEGAIFAAGSATFRISYTGGDGNDVTLTAVSVPKSWTGAVSGAWSDPLNWYPQTVPAAREALVFPIASRLGMTNDLPAGTQVGPMTFDDSYSLSGNALTLTGDLNFAAAVGFACTADLKLAVPVQFNQSGAGSYSGAVDINGQTLTINSFATSFSGPINGSGSIVITGDAVSIASSGTFSGTIQGDVNVVGNYPNATVTSGRLSGTGLLGAVTVTRVLSPGSWGTHTTDPHVRGILNTGPLTINGVSFKADPNGFFLDLSPFGASDQVRVSGPVSLSGPVSINVAISVGSPALDQTFTIIDNDGTDPIHGTFYDAGDPNHPSGPFRALPEGATFTVGSSTFRISYVGGDGNDVTLTVVRPLADTSTVLTQDASSTKAGQSWTLKATVTSASGTPSGSVVFVADGVTLGNAPVVNGVASLTASIANAGLSSISATFVGSGGFANSVAGSISHTVVRGQTKTEIVSDHPGSVYGQTVSFNITVSALSPAAGQPAGSVNVLADGTPLGTVTLGSGRATFETAALRAGLHSITATYGGDGNFEASTASAIQQTIAKAHTEIDARNVTPIVVGAATFINVSVNVSASPSLLPSGNVSVSERGRILDTQSLNGGVATLSIASLPAGDYTLIVNYDGNADFEPSSVPVGSVGLPTLSVHETRAMEGNRGITVVSLAVTLSAQPSQPVRVSFSTVPGSATEGEDYEKATGVIEFAPGEHTHAIELHIFGDTIAEADETFSVILFDPVNATIDTSSAVVVIVNDDTVPPRRRSARH
jgi:hypothetical protein